LAGKRVTNNPNEKERSRNPKIDKGFQLEN
jgi:hypothetical protein